jgi:hypothetical protein
MLADNYENGPRGRGFQTFGFPDRPHAQVLDRKGRPSARNLCCENRLGSWPLAL